MKLSKYAIAALVLWLPLVLSANQELITKQTDDNQWVLPGKNYSATRYSTLKQITAGNAKNLRQVWSFSTGALRGHEGRLANQVEIHPGAGRSRRSCRVLRPRSSRGEFRAGSNLHDHARRPGDRTRCGNWQGSMEGSQRRPDEGRNADHGGPRCQRQVHRRCVWR